MNGLTEAIASTAASHPDGHGCAICRAAAGDEEAMAFVTAGVMLGGWDVLGPRNSAFQDKLAGQEDS